jgi:hypothetical protein
MLAGALGGIFAYFSQEELECVQTQCVACGATEAKFVISLGSRLESTKEDVSKGVYNHDEILQNLLKVKAE